MQQSSTGAGAVAPPARLRRALSALAAAAGLFGGLPGTAGATVSAEGPAELAALPLDALLDVEVSGASKFPQLSSETSAAVTVITASEIRAMGWRTLADALRSVRGLSVNDDRSYSYLSVRGFFVPGDYNTRVLLLVDGQRTNDVVYDQAYLGSEFALDMEMVKRIEFIPGPGSAVYGANALFGVINVITRRPGSRGVDGASVSLGSGDSRRLRLGDSHRLPDGTVLQWSASRSLSGGFDVPVPGGPVVHGADYEQRSALYLRATRGEVEATVLGSERLKGAPILLDAVPGDPRTSNRDEQSMAALNWRHPLDASSEVSLRGSVGHYRFIGQYVYDIPPVTVNSDVVSGQWWGAEARWFTTAWQGHRLVAGVEMQQAPHLRQKNLDLGTDAVYLDDDRSSHRSAVYAEDQMEIAPRWTFSVGARWDRDKSSPGQFSPRLALVWKPSESLVAKAIHGGAYRPPNAYEAFYAVDTVGGYKLNPSLQPESVKGDELEAEWRPDPHDRLTASVYRNRADKLIQLVPDPTDGLLEFRNAARVQARGLEVQLEHLWTGGARVRAGFSLQHVRDSNSVEPIGVYAPKQLGTIAAIVPLFNDWSAGLEWEGVSRRAGAPGYGTVNLTLSSALPAHGWSVSLGAHDLLDRRPTDPGTDLVRQPEVPQAGRSLQLRLDFAF